MYKKIQIRTIEEATQLKLPLIPKAYLEEGAALVSRFETGQQHPMEMIRQLYALVDKVYAVVAPFAVC